MCEVSNFSTIEGLKQLNTPLELTLSTTVLSAHKHNPTNKTIVTIMLLPEIKFDLFRLHWSCSSLTGHASGNLLRDQSREQHQCRQNNSNLIYFYLLLNRSYLYSDWIILLSTYRLVKIENQCCKEWMCDTYVPSHNVKSAVSTHDGKYNTPPLGSPRLQYWPRMMPHRFYNRTKQRK